jgi:hypothetical protein
MPYKRMASGMLPMVLMMQCTSAITDLRFEIVGSYTLCKYILPNRFDKLSGWLTFLPYLFG